MRLFMMFLRIVAGDRRGGGLRTGGGGGLGTGGGGGGGGGGGWGRGKNHIDIQFWAPKNNQVALYI